MKDVFNAYAKYYDLFYGDKDYDKESAFIKALLEKHSILTINNILELGCGTGKHAVKLADFGFNVKGIDLSSQMIERAYLLKQELLYPKNLNFEVGDARNYRSLDLFEAVISLFHVLSYQNSNQEVFDLFETASSHLPINGIFIFDCWYGPGVLTERPEVRIKSYEDEEIRVNRVATPLFNPNKNLVDVNFEINLHNKFSNEEEKILESHVMRYFFVPELEELLLKSGFEIIESGEWITGNKLGFDTWISTFVCRKVK